MNDANSELQNWKQKYYDALGELESKEKSWADTEHFLRQGLSRLTLAADSSSETLNRQLEKLRTLLRGSNNDTELRQLLDSVSESIRQLDEQRKNLQILPPPPELLEDVIGRIRFPRGMGHKAKALQKKMLQADEGAYQPLIEEFVSLVMEALHWAAEDASSMQEQAEEKGGLLGKLFGRKENTVPGDNNLQLAKTLLQEVVEGLVEPADTRELMLQRLEQGEHETQLYALGRELITLLRPLCHGELAQEPGDEQLPSHEVLLRLVERIEIPGALSGKVESIKALLAEAMEPKAMERAIIAIAELVGDMRSQVQSEKSEIENFLKQMTERLQEIDATFQLNFSNQRESYEGGLELDSAVTAQVQGIEESVIQAQDIVGLKEALQERVDTIRNHMQQFRESEKKRLAMAEQQVEQLTDRLQSVQQESDKLRMRLKEERDLAMIDPLTGIPNRLAYNERLEQEVARWQRYKSPLVLTVWDVDRFKTINDSYGHQAGDKVLTVIAKLLHKQVRETDFVARFGGEEFVLLLPETELEGATLVAEQIRKSVESCEFHFRGNPVPITISCGMSQFREGDSAEQVFARADGALYKAKDDGRNRCHAV